MRVPSLVSMVRLTDADSQDGLEVIEVVGREVAARRRKEEASEWVSQSMASSGTSCPCISQQSHKPCSVEQQIAK